MKQAGLITSLLLVSGAMPHAALAQESVEETAQEIVVTASGRAQAIADAPASISILTREELAQRPFTSLEDALRNVEGVSVVGGDPNSTDIVIRGMPGEYTLIMLDGRRQSTRETMNRGTGGVQANLIPPLAAIERIEVVRGPMSSLYGSDAMGGVVNVITRKVPERLAVSLTAGGMVQADDAHGNMALGNVWIGTPLASDRIGLQIYGGVNDRAEDDIFYPTSFTAGTNQILDRNINGKLSVIVAPGHDLTLEGGYNFLRYTDTPGKSAAPTAQLIQEAHKRNYQALTYNGDIGAAHARGSVYRENEVLESRQAGAVLNRPDLTNTTVDALVSTPLWGWNMLTVGGQYIRASVTGIGAQDSVPGYVNTDKAARDSWAVFAEDQIRPIDALTLTAGGRLDHYSDFGAHFTPRLYVNYRIVPGLTLRGGFAGGFKAPTLRQSVAEYCMSTGGGSLPRGPLCGNPDLKPETSTTEEIGLRYDGPGKLALGVTLYHTLFKNKVVSFDSELVDPVDPSRPLYIYDNVDRVDIKGVELTASVPLTRALLVGANYTYTDSTRKGSGEPAFDGSSLDGLPLDKTPEHLANIRLDWDVTEQVHAYVLGQYLGRQYYTGFRNGAVATRTRGPSTTVDVGLSFNVNEHFSLKMAVLNLTDKIVPIDDRGRFDGLDGNWMIDEGRRFWGTATISF